MSLTPEQIKALLAKPEKQQRKTKGGIDTAVRDHATWFKLAHRIFDRDDPDPEARLECDNPNCQDPRDRRAIVIAEVAGIKMCRYCFLSGYGLKDPEQLELSDNG